MSVITTADEKLANAKQHLQGAIEDIAEIVVQQCEGWDDYVPTFREKLTDTLLELVKIRDEIER